MASDFGDEAGGELYEWMLRIGQDAGEQAMRDAARGLAQALRNMRDGAEHADELAPESVEKPQWAKLDMAEIDALPDPSGVRRALSERMDNAGVVHAFTDDAANGRSYLLFKTEDASRLYSCIDELLEEIGDTAERAADEIARRRDAELRRHNHERGPDDPDKEPLEKQAEYARAASEQIERERSGERAAEREPRFQENRSK